MTEGYLRQRRNLLSICILLLLAILGGAENISLLTLKLKHPEVAEYFAWSGFLYFWYRVYMYAPSKLTELFRNEIILRLIYKHKNKEYNNFNLEEYAGSIEIHIPASDNKKTQLILRGHSSVIDIENRSLEIPVGIKQIFSYNNQIANVFDGKVVTDYFLPHLIALITILVGVNKYYPDALLTLLPVMLVSALLYLWVSNKK
jgi:hypothetical protein